MMVCEVYIKTETKDYRKNDRFKDKTNEVNR